MWRHRTVWRRCHRRPHRRRRRHRRRNRQRGSAPGTASPSPNNGIFRSEPRSEEDGANGNGYATGISYDGATDTFTVDGLAFDGGNVYQRGNPVSSLNDGAFSVYEADQQFPDSVTNTPVNQLTHRAIYGVSRNIDANGQPETQFAIVRTGAYVGYGFGGFVYQRANDVNMPSSGQAVFNGRSAGLRDFNERGGLEYTTANVEVAIDFDDFNDDTGGRGDGVRGEFTNRRVFDIDGNDITAAVLARINNQNDASLSSLPDARFGSGPACSTAMAKRSGRSPATTPTMRARPRSTRTATTMLFFRAKIRTRSSASS